MVESSAISALEQAAGNLDRMLSSWTQSRAAELESAPQSDPREFINYGIHTLWRMVAIHRSIEHFKNPPAPPADPEPPTSASTSSPATPMASGPGTPIAVSASSLPGTPISASASGSNNSALRTPHSALASLATHHSPLITPSVVPSVPCVPLLRSLTSPEAIAARIERLSAELTARIKAEPDSAPERAAAVSAAADQLGMKLLDTITRRDKFPGSGKFLNSIRADLINSPP